jgi:FkbM family methyltransferase
MSLIRLLPDRWKERLRRRAGAITPQGRLENLARAGFAPRKIIDAGAYRGEWTLLARKVFPTAMVLLVEPQPHLAAHLQGFCAQRPQTKFRSALLGAAPGRARFVFSETNSRIVDDGYTPAPGERTITLPVEPLQDIARTEDFSDCDLLKLDLQGHELRALEGAGSLFGQVEVIVAEISWLRIGDVPLLHEVLGRFQEKGYQAYDIWGFNYRPLDGALWQTDVMFVRKDSPLLASRQWSHG